MARLEKTLGHLKAHASDADPTQLEFLVAHFVCPDVTHRRQRRRCRETMM
jgi:hypothetical protein